MIRLFVFVFAIMAYSTIGLVAFSQLTPTDQSGQTAQTSPTEPTVPVGTAGTVSSSDPNMTVVHKSTALPVVGSPDLQRCVAEGCIVGISI